MEQSKKDLLCPNLKLFKKGKVREVYELENGRLLIVATDRVSAFDDVLPVVIPGKGKILTAMTNWWLDRLSYVKNHRITSDVTQYPEECQEYADVLKHRSMMVKGANTIPLESIVRGYLTGSGWKDYQETGKVCGIELPKGMNEFDRLPQPIFTPSTKSDHDENQPEEYFFDTIGKEVMSRIKQYSLSLFKNASYIASKAGILIADTKFEFGLNYSMSDEACEFPIPMIIDELLTPDSSRFWPANTPHGTKPESMDKQIIRDWIKINDHIPENRRILRVPDDVLMQTLVKYYEIYFQLIHTR